MYTIDKKLPYKINKFRTFFVFDFKLMGLFAIKYIYTKAGMQFSFTTVNLVGKEAWRERYKWLNKRFLRKKCSRAAHFTIQISLNFIYS